MRVPGRGGPNRGSGCERRGRTSLASACAGAGDRLRGKKTLNVSFLLPDSIRGGSTSVLLGLRGAVGRGVAGAWRPQEEGRLWCGWWGAWATS